MDGSYPFPTMTASEAANIVMTDALANIDRAFGVIRSKPYTPHPRLAEAREIYAAGRTARILAKQTVCEDGCFTEENRTRRTHGTYGTYRGSAW